MKNAIKPEPAKSAKIINFSRRRGRPKNNRPPVDTGTPETVMKRLLGVTSEALDLCLAHKIIDHRQHWCGIHLRWLYTLRHGAPSVRAINPSHIDGYEVKSEDPEWRADREKEYITAINTLSKTGHAILLLNLCVYNERPRCLGNFPISQKAGGAEITKDIANIRDAFDILNNLWKPG
jgi:hypothetical protein